MSFTVLVPQQVDEAGILEMHAAGLTVIEAPDTDPGTLEQLIRGCQGVLVRTVRLDAELLGAAPDLRVVSRHGAGVDNVDLAYCRSHGVQVTYAPLANGIAVAEHAIGLLLAVTKNIPRCDDAVRRGDFAARNRDYGVELAGKTLGVIGLGRTGLGVATRAAAGLGMEVIGTDPHVDAGSVPPEVSVVPLERLLASADAVSIHVPLVPATRGLIGAAELSRMKARYLVNCSRGGVVDELALVEALSTGSLRAAGVDVFEQEPLPAGHPLTQLDNVVLTPHMAAHTTESLARMAVHAAQGIISVARGEDPEWPVAYPAAHPTKKGRP
jgi:D-3-phosphoglycerate dehydrogenase